MSAIIPRGAVLMVQLDPTVGHEQQGKRPCIVISPPDLVANQRYPVLVVVPLTGTTSLPPTYPVIQPYPRGLTKASSALVDQVRCIDKQRVVSQFAPLPHADMKRVDEALRRVLGL